MFYEEARELLISLEEGLMELERRQNDRAHLDKTFRAAHSLKGAGAMVGLAAISEFTHFIEAVLERIRTGALAVDSDIITTLLESRDHLAAMVEGEAAKSPVPASGELIQRLSALLRGPGRGGSASGGGASPARSPSAPPEPAGGAERAESAARGSAAGPVPAATPVPAPTPDRPAQSEPAAAPNAPEPAPGSASSPRQSRGSRRKKGEAATPPPSDARPGTTARKTRKMKQAPPPPIVPPGPAAEATNGGEESGVYLIGLAPGSDVLRRGINPLGVLDELRELGEAQVTANTEHVPPLEQLDPERCYLSWSIRLKTREPLARIEEVFLFLSEDSTITIAQESADGTLTPLRSSAVAGMAAGLPAGPALEPTVERAEPSKKPTAVVPEGLAAASSEPSPAANGSPAKPAPAGPPAAARGAPAPRPHSRIRVDAAQLDDMVGLAGELVVLSDNLIGLREVPGAEPWTHALEALERVSREIRDTTLDLRMVPVDELFSRFPRVVRDLADRSGKEIELRILGQDTRLDRTIVERLSDPMVHLIRNAVDHALESPQERAAKGKPRSGRITLAAGHEGDRVAIRVEDDGRGLDREKIVRKGIALEMIPSGTSPDDPRVVSLIFEPGFSTRENVSDLSGRGVGLDVVRDAVRALRGSVTVESTPGKGTAFLFRLPLTLALIDGLLVETAGGRYVVPLAQVEECVALESARSALAEGRPCVAVRGELVPTVSLRGLFGANGPQPARQELLLTRHAGQRVGIAVDRLLGRVQAVIQSLGQGLHGLNRFSGATILGDGSVSLILDLSALVSESRFGEQSARATF
jgi:two-component system, chemotaxis family, sensor kinase CheA